MNNGTINTARVIEFGSVTAGIAVPEEGGFRFFSSQRAFDALDGRRFRSLRQITAAVHDRWQRSIPPKPRSPRTNPADAPADLLLAIPGPFLLPV
jgi:hypothetical protein